MLFHPIYPTPSRTYYLFVIIKDNKYLVELIDVHVWWWSGRGDKVAGKVLKTCTRVHIQVEKEKIIGPDRACYGL